PRGRGGDVGISELPHCVGARAIYEGALHVTARRMEDILTVESTPLGKGGVFHELSRGAYGAVARYEIPWWLCGALCDDVAVAAHEAPAMPTADRVERFGSEALKTVYASMTEKAFRQESELAFSDMEEAVFPTELILTCAEADFGDVDATLLFRRVDTVPSAVDWQWLAARRSGPLVAGYDPARSRDAAALVILDRVGERLVARMMVSFTGVPFATQKEVIRGALAHGVVKLAVDSTGVGLDLAETLSAEFPHRVEPVVFTPKTKELMVGGAYHAFTDRRLLIPADRDLIAELASLREEVTPAGGRIYHARRSAAGHADRAWGLLLALFAARNAPIQGPVAYESISRRTRRW
ncbi:MAG: hypothetical protein HQK87_11390, partial [Nitrospinae bacterium]|nr:hypothetical protein [Nitrospinota bacterium]